MSKEMPGQKRCPDCKGKGVVAGVECAPCRGWGFWPKKKKAG